MKELVVKNYQESQSQTIEQNGNKFTVKPVITNEEGRKYAINFVEVEPANYAYGYHWHEMNEEAFYIISGEGIVRTVDGDIKVKTGDVITFPSGPKGAHVIRNSSDSEKLIYIDFGTNNITEIVHLPDINKIMAVGPYSNGLYDFQN